MACKLVENTIPLGLSNVSHGHLQRSCACHVPYTHRFLTKTNDVWRGVDKTRFIHWSPKVLCSKTQRVKMRHIYASNTRMKNEFTEFRQKFVSTHRVTSCSHSTVIRVFTFQRHRRFGYCRTSRRNAVPDRSGKNWPSTAASESAPSARTPCAASRSWSDLLWTGPWERCPPSWGPSETCQDMEPFPASSSSPAVDFEK